MTAAGIGLMIRGGDTPPAAVSEGTDGDEADGDGIGVTLGDGVREGVACPAAGCGELVEDPVADGFAAVEVQLVARQPIASAHRLVRILEAKPILAPRIRPPYCRYVSGLECPDRPDNSFHH